MIDPALLAQTVLIGEKGLAVLGAGLGAGWSSSVLVKASAIWPARRWRELPANPKPVAASAPT